MTTEELVKVLRDSVNISNKESGVEDGAVIALSDDDLKLSLKVSMSRTFPDITDFEDLPDGSAYPIILLSKIDMYLRLAVLRAEQVNLVADNNNQLQQGQRFDHYMKLAEEARTEYENWVNDDSSGGCVQSYDVLLVNRHFTKRNYELTPTPKVTLKINNVTTESADVNWGVSNVNHFGRYEVYVSDSPIVDKYKEGAYAQDKIDEKAKLVKRTSNIRNNVYKVKDLEAEKTYYIAVVCIERNQVFGYTEKSFTTLAELQNTDELEI